VSTQLIEAPGSDPASAECRPADREGPQPVSAVVYWRRRAVVVVALLAVAFLLTGLIGRVGAEADLEDKVAGHVVVEPGETLWEVAVQTAPSGVDTREHLDALRELNGFDGSHLEAWTVVLIPAR
jgi:hypothetical protein